MSSYMPDGYRILTPYLIVRGTNDLMSFLREAFGAAEINSCVTDDGQIMHAARRIGDSVIEMGEASEEFPARPGSLHMYVEDADAVYARALAAGATSLRGPADQFYGDREASAMDSWGNHWYIATHVRDVSPEEMQRTLEPSVS